MLNQEQKINQMFVLGFDGEEPSDDLLKLVSDGLGGVIFFTQNIVTRKQIKAATAKIRNNALVTPFLSIDQEGGRVERTQNLYKGKSKYLSQLDAAYDGIENVVDQIQRISKELKNFGLNMNYAPVLDVNTNSSNPIIGNRAFSAAPSRVEDFGKAAIQAYIDCGIIPVAKHFPGHGDTWADSHEELPVVDLNSMELLGVHVRPFKAAKEIVPAMMIAHVHYKCFDKKTIPASLSKNVIGFLRKDLGYKGLVVSDDMLMGGITSHYTSFEAVKLGIEAGVNQFIFRNSDEKTLALIEQVKEAVRNGEIKESKIDASAKIILKTKSQFGIL